MSFKTADLYDVYSDSLSVCVPMFADFGGVDVFYGEIVTVKCFEDNSRVKELSATPGAGCVLVVDGGGSERCALLGDMIAEAFVQNRWAGVIINGCVRDTVDLAQMNLGIKALNCMPRKSTRRGEGQVDLPVHFADVTFTPGAWVYADHDGIVVAPHQLDLTKVEA